MTMQLKNFIQRHRISQEDNVTSEVEIEVPENLEESEPDGDVETVADKLVELEAEQAVGKGHELDQIAKSLEHYGDFLGRVNQAGGFQPGEGALFSMGISHLKAQLGQEALTLGVEDFGMSRSRKMGTQIANEDFKETVKAWFKKFMEWLRGVKDKLVAFSDRTAAKLKAAKQSVEETIRAVSLYTKKEATVTITPKKGIGKEDIEGNSYKFAEYLKVVNGDLNTLNGLAKEFGKVLDNVRNVTEDNVQSKVDELAAMSDKLSDLNLEMGKTFKITSVAEIGLHGEDDSIQIKYETEPEEVEITITRQALLTQLKRNLIGYEGGVRLATEASKLLLNAMSFERQSSKINSELADKEYAQPILSAISKASNLMASHLYVYSNGLNKAADVSIAMKETMASIVSAYAKSGKKGEE